MVPNQPSIGDPSSAYLSIRERGSSSALRIDYFGPKFFFLLIWIAGVVVPVLPFLAGDDGFSLYYKYDFTDKNAAVSLALAYYCLALVAVICGIEFSSRVRGIRRARISKIVPRGSFMRRAGALTLIGVASLLAVVWMLGGLSGLLQGASDRIRAFAGLNGFFLAMNGLLAVCLAWYVRITSRIHVGTLERIAFWTYLVVSIGLVALQGQKSTLFICILALVIVWHYRVKRITFARYTAVGALLFVGLMAYHLVKQELLVTGEIPSLEGQRGVLPSFAKFLETQFTANLMELQTMSVLVDAVPRDLDWQRGRMLAMVALILVPRQLYPDKPLTTAGVFTEAFWPEKWENEGTTIPPGIFGELYLNFGVLGVLMGGLALGYIWGRIYRRMRDRRGDDCALVAHALSIASMLHFFRGELASVLLLVMSFWIPFLFLCGTARPRSSDPRLTGPGAELRCAD